MSSGEMTCSSCKATFPAPPRKNTGSLKCPQCGAKLVAAWPKTRRLGETGDLSRFDLVSLAAVAVAVLIIAGDLDLPDVLRASQEAAAPCAGGTGWGRRRNQPRCEKLERKLARPWREAESRFITTAPGLEPPSRWECLSVLEKARHLPNARAGILQRELIRQALLIAAREELGLLTRDDVVGERQNDQASGGHWPRDPHDLRASGLIRVVI